MDLFNQTDNGATFSACKKYRFVLWRIWDKTLPAVMFIGLNPSTANESKNDPTITRVVKFASDWGFGGVYMLNLFTYVTAYPKELVQCQDPLLNADKYLIEYAAKADKIIFAWGNFQEAQERGKQAMQMFTGYALHINKNGSPKHPLYVKQDVKPILIK